MGEMVTFMRCGMEFISAGTVAAISKTDEEGYL